MYVVPVVVSLKNTEYVFCLRVFNRNNVCSQVEIDQLAFSIAGGTGSCCQRRESEICFHSLGLWAEQNVANRQHKPSIDILIRTLLACPVFLYW